MADATGIGIPASSISVRYPCIPVLDWGILIPVPVSPAYRHLTKLHNGASTEGSSVRLKCRYMVLHSSVENSVAQLGTRSLVEFRVAQ
jgi:hypothetical protein